MLKHLIDDLEALLVGRLSPSDFEARHPIRDVSGHLEAIWCNLQHYLADADIRERDSDYKAFQDAELGKLLAHLRAGRVDQASRINFLSESHA
jgi:hypothetical protein